MIVDRARLPVPGGAGILEGADQFFLLGVHTDDGQALIGVALTLPGNMQELRIAEWAFAGCNLLAVDAELVVHLFQ